MQRAGLGDARLDRRLVKIVEAMAALPGGSIPQQSGSEAAREATYQFLNNPRVTFEGVLGPHARKTCDRMSEARTALVVHDTTEFHFRGASHREGLGRLGRGSGEGFFCHLALGVGLGDHRRPLGVVCAETFVRGEARKPDLRNMRQFKDRESLRWGRSIEAAEAAVDGRARLIHVLDSEGDIYEVLEDLTTKKRGFIIRASKDRRLVDEYQERAYLFSQVQLEVPLAQTVAQLSPRTPRREPNQPRRREGRNRARQARTAVLDVKAISVCLRMPREAAGQALARTVDVNVVAVTESEPPVGEEAISWVLLTSEPIDSPDALRHVIDGYRARWLVEEYFKVIKTGCAYEKVQLESYEALLVELGMVLPVAYDLLLARYLSRTEPDTPATEVFRTTLIAVLRHELDGKLPDVPSVEDALYAIARLGGHIKNNGPPGWAVLGRGYERALLLERGWRAARGLRSDQS